MGETWADTLNAGAITGAGFSQPDQGSGGIRSGLSSAVGTAGGPNPPLYSPDNPLFWFGGALLAVAGLIGLSGWVDLGPLKLKGKV
jgi:hypothetical protein